MKYAELALDEKPEPFVLLVDVDVHGVQFVSTRVDACALGESHEHGLRNAVSLETHVRLSALFELYFSFVGRGVEVRPVVRCGIELDPGLQELGREHGIHDQTHQGLAVVERLGPGDLFFAG